MRKNWASVAQGHKRADVNARGWGFDFLKMKREIKYLIFSFPHSGNEINGGVEFRHSARNTFTMRRKMAKGSILLRTELLTLDSLF